MSWVKKQKQMTKKIKCQILDSLESEEVKVRVIKATMADKDDLRNIILCRANALVV